MRGKHFIILLFLFPVLSFAQSANWSDHVANIIYDKCSNCHHIGSIAPMELMSYADAVANAVSIADEVTTRKMPPWPPDHIYQQYAHQRILTQAEIDTIVNWVNNGTPSGVLSSAPPAPVYTTAWQIPSPDLTLQTPAYSSTASSFDEYRAFVLPTSIGMSRYIEQMEIIPGNGAIVHHVQIYTDMDTICEYLDAQDSIPGYPCFGGLGDMNAKLVGTWTPGQALFVLPPGFGIKLPMNCNVIVQIHYKEGTAGQCDSTRINLKFAPIGPTREVFFEVPLSHANGSLVEDPFVIPGNGTKTFHEIDTVEDHITIFAVKPHMHYVGRWIRAFGVTPAGDTLKLVKVDDWKFHWQGQYTFVHPLIAPVGTVLYAEAFFDNTPANLANPNPTTQPVIAGEQSTDEMMMVAINYAIYKPGDEYIIMDSSMVAGISTQSYSEAISVFPNPTKDILHIRSNDQRSDIFVELFNLLGESVIQKQKCKSIDLSTISPGIYLVRIVQGDRIHSEKIIRN